MTEKRTKKNVELKRISDVWDIVYPFLKALPWSVIVDLILRLLSDAKEGKK